MRNLIFLAIIALAGLSLWAWITYSGAGETTTLQPRFDGQCLESDALGGVQDLAIDWSTRDMFVAGPSGVRQMPLDQDPVANDGVMLGRVITLVQADPDAPPPSTQAMRDTAIDITDARDGSRVLFRAHALSNAVEIQRYVLTQNGVSDVQSFATVFSDVTRGEDFISLAAVDENTVFIAIARAPARSLFDAMRGRLTAQNGTLLHVTAEETTTVTTNLETPTGLAYDPASGVLYVAEAGFRGLSVWQQSAERDLTLVERRTFGNSPGRLQLDPETRLWLTVHPHTLNWLSGARPSPTQVGFFNFAEKIGDQVYLTGGKPLAENTAPIPGDAAISAGAAAYVDPDQRRLVIFGPDETGLWCELPEIWRHSEAYPAQRPQGRGGP